jgi:phosphomevalonate kinase
MSAASAPGKIMLAGEYAVLDGGVAVVMAVDRRVRATLSPRPGPPSPVLAALIAELATDAEAATRARQVTADSSALRTADGVKLGLGSSAAVCVAAAALAVPAAGRPALAALAHRAHRRAQGGRGSGADVAASVHGGVIAVVPDSNPEHPPRVEALALPPDLWLIPVWTGRAAHTPSLVKRVRAAGQRHPSGYAAATAAITAAARALVDACGSADAGAAVEALAAGAAAVAGLGRLAGIELESERHRALAALAREAGGAIKPTGAGAGDLAVAGFADPAAAAAFRQQIARAGTPALPLSVDRRGVSRE